MVIQTIEEWRSPENHCFFIQSLNLNRQCSIFLKLSQEVYMLKIIIQ